MNDSTSGWNAFLSGYTVYYQHFLDDVLEEVIIFELINNFEYSAEKKYILVTFDYIDIKTCSIRAFPAHTKTVFR